MYAELRLFGEVLSYDRGTKSGVIKSEVDDGKFRFSLENVIPSAKVPYVGMPVVFIALPDSSAAVVSPLLPKDLKSKGKL